MLELSYNSPLSFPLVLMDGTSIETVGDAAYYFSSLPPDRRDQSHWMLAIRMLNTALREPTYLKSATTSVQTAFLLDGTLMVPHPLDRSKAKPTT